MPNLILAPSDAPVVWPYSLAQLRQDNPNVSFSANPTADDLAPFDVFEVADTDQPAHDPRTERVEKVEPALDEHGWRQQWRIRAATPEEVAAYDEANRPAPDWAQFRRALISENGYAGAFAAIGTINPMLTGPLPARLDRFEFEGHWQPFLDSLSIALAALPANPADPSLSAGHIAIELLALAGRCNLPAAFCEALEALLEQG